MYTRGQFAVIGKVGRKALRLYHEEGLLVPACIVMFPKAERKLGVGGDKREEPGTPPLPRGA